MIFKCKNCGGNVVYSPERKKMFCPFCESEDSEERQDGVIVTKTVLRRKRPRQQEQINRKESCRQPKGKP